MIASPVPVHDLFISNFVRSSPLNSQAVVIPEEIPMRQFIRPAATALSIACLAASAAVLSSGAVLAQSKMAPPPAPQGKMAPPPAQAAPPAGGQMQLKQIALTQKQIDGALASQKDMDAITSKMQPNARPDQKTMAALDGVARKYGFASFDDYNTVMDNIGVVYGGIDPATKKFVGSQAVIKAQIAQVQADKKMSAKDKKEALDDLNEALRQPEPAIQNKGNIDLVAQNYDKLSPIMNENQ